MISRIRDRASPDLNVLFLESQYSDLSIFQQSFQLKLLGPDYKTQNLKIALDDFERRVALCEKAYVPLGDAEEIDRFSYA